MNEHDMKRLKDWWSKRCIDTQWRLVHAMRERNRYRQERDEALKQAHAEWERAEKAEAENRRLRELLIAKAAA